jgi:hypothetical protein
MDKSPVAEETLLEAMGIGAGANIFYYIPVVFVTRNVID